MKNLLACVSFVVLAVPLTAQTAVETKHLSVRPSPAPSPALKFHLIPWLVEETPGNAALVYLRALSPEWWSNVRAPAYWKKIEAWSQLPAGELPRKELDWLLKSQQLRELDRAARKDNCAWEMTDRIREENYRMHMPEISGFRDLSRLLVLRTQLQILDGHYDAAAQSIQTGLALGRDLSKYPSLISSLVGIAIQRQMLDLVEEWIQRPDGPNLFWALVDLPRPAIDLRLSLQGERLSALGMFPPLHELETIPLTPRQALEAIEPFLRLSESKEGRRESTAGEQLLLTALTLKHYPTARRWALDYGLKPELVNAMPSLQVVLVYSLHQYDVQYDEVIKGFSLPYWQGRPYLEKSDRQLRALRGQDAEGIPIASTLLPAVPRMAASSARIDRRFAALRCVEAVRLYAAAHDGRAPDRLEDITDLPMPLDPMTGKPFEYQKEGDRVILSAPVPPGDIALPDNALRYEITVKP